MSSFSGTRGGDGQCDGLQRFTIVPLALQQAAAGGGGNKKRGGEEEEEEEHLAKTYQEA